MKQEPKDLSQEEINFLKDIFFVFDKGRDGDISCTEIKNLLAKFGFEHSLKDIDDMIREKDLDQDGRINFDEFYRIISRDTSSLERMMEAKQIFDLCDTNSDGKIDRGELQAYFQKIGIPLSEKEIDDMISVADGNRNGFVEFEEFVKLFQ